jgi:hypothetical protein
LVIAFIPERRFVGSIGGAMPFRLPDTRTTVHGPAFHNSRFGPNIETRFDPASQSDFGLG